MAIEIPKWMELEVPAEHLGMLQKLFNGPDDVRSLFERVTVEDTRDLDMPDWAVDGVRGLRPLSRKFLVRTFSAHGFHLEENPWTRSLGFFENWAPTTEV